MIARAATASGPGRFRRPVFPSELPGVSAVAWDAFVRAVSSGPIRARSRSGGVGSFDLKPRRLGELEVMVNLRRWAHGWEGDLSPEYAALGEDAAMQYRVFARSVRLYDEDLGAGKVVVPVGVTRSGALGVLHCAGAGALRRWPEGAFKTTLEVFERTNGLF